MYSLYKINQFLSLLAFSMYFFTTNLLKLTTLNQFTTISFALKAVLYISYAVISYRIVSGIFIDKYKFKQLILLIVIFIFLIISAFYSNRSTLVELFLFLLGVSTLERRKVIKLSFILQLIILTLTIVSSFIGLLPNWTYMRVDSIAEIRYSYGYTYPSHISSVFLFLVLMYTYLRKEKLSYLEVICIEIINLLVYNITDSRAAFLMVLFWGLIILIIRFRKSFRIKRTLMSSFGAYLIVFFALLSFYGAYNYDAHNDVMLFFNKLTNTRLRLAYSAINQYGIHLFGSDITWIGHGGRGYIYSSSEIYNYVDNSYIQIMLTYGIIVLFVVIVGYVSATKRAIKENDKFLYLIFILIAIYSCIEPRLIEVYFNPFILFLLPSKTNNNFNG